MVQGSAAWLSEISKGKEGHFIAQRIVFYVFIETWTTAVWFMDFDNYRERY